MKKLIIVIICIAAIFFGWQYISGGNDIESEQNKEAVKVVADSQVYTEELSFDNRYYHTLLSDKEKKAYERLAEGISENEEEIKVWVGGEASVNRIVKAVYYDFPEFFWFECGASYETYELLGYSRIRPNYIYSGEEKKENKLAVQEYVDKVYEQADGSSDYEKIKSVYDYVILNTDYVDKAPDDQDILSVMKNGKSVCAGYSKTIQVLLRCLGFECIYVTGEDDNSGGHAWNMVRLGDNYYHIDATWGDPVYTESSEEYRDYVSYAYLLCPDEDILKTHKYNDDFTYPECTSDEYASYVVEGTYFKEYSEDEIYEKLKAGIDEEEKCMTLKFSTKEVYETAYDGLINNGLLKKVMRYQMLKTLRPSAHCNYSNNDDMRTISIFFEFD